MKNLFLRKVYRPLHWSTVFSKWQPSSIQSILIEYCRKSWPLSGKRGSPSGAHSALRELGLRSDYIHLFPYCRRGHSSAFIQSDFGNFFPKFNQIEITQKCSNVDFVTTFPFFYIFWWTYLYFHLRIRLNEYLLPWLTKRRAFSVCNNKEKIMGQRDKWSK